VILRGDVAKEAKIRFSDKTFAFASGEGGHKKII